MEQPLDALVFGVERRPNLPPLVRVTQELIDGFLQRILDTGALELGHHQRDAVHEQHGVGDHVPAPAGQFDLELIDDQKIVVRRVLEIDEPHRLWPAAIPIGQAIGHRALEQQLRRRLVDFHQPVPGSLLQVPNGARNAGLIQPRPAVAQVEPPQRRREPALQQHLAGAGPLGGFRQIRIALDPLPAHAFDLPTEGPLDEVAFPLDLHGSGA